MKTGAAASQSKTWPSLEPSIVACVLERAGAPALWDVLRQDTKLESGSKIYAPMRLNSKVVSGFTT